MMLLVFVRGTDSPLIGPHQEVTFKCHQFTFLGKALKRAEIKRFSEFCEFLEIVFLWNMCCYEFLTIHPRCSVFTFPSKKDKKYFTNLKRHKCHLFSHNLLFANFFRWKNRARKGGYNSCITWIFSYLSLWHPRRVYVLSWPKPARSCYLWKQRSYMKLPWMRRKLCCWVASLSGEWVYGVGGGFVAHPKKERKQIHLELSESQFASWLNLFVIHSLKLTAIAPESRSMLPHKETILFQLSIFRFQLAVSFRLGELGTTFGKCGG